MSAPIRFLGLAIIAYVGLRTASSALALEAVAPAGEGASPGQEALAAATLPPGVPADMDGPPYDPYAPALYPPAPYPPMPAAYGNPYAQGYGPMPYPYMAAAMPYPMMAAAQPAPRASRIVYYPAPYPMPAPPAYAPAAMPRGEAPPAMAASFDGGGGGGEGYGSAVAPLDQWPTIGSSGPSSLGSAMQVTPRWEKGARRSRTPLEAARPDRWSVDGWALLRPREGTYRLDDTNGALNPGLAPAGSLGGSQAGMRISWRPLSTVGIHLRASTALMPGGRSVKNQQMVGGEGAVGVSWQPLKALPVRLLAERRQRLGAALGGGRDAFALLAEGGLYEQPLPYGLVLDGYGQAGVVGANRRDLFADGALTATYPFMRRFAFGGGMWGGIQPGLSRFDAGPRLSYQLRPGLRAHVDYRFRLTGKAEPRSGPALTLAAGF
ncbi:hypothetical protein GGQ97_000888 [Sphingomonas kaistensis]|uniref:Uncharacterized protein n=1 Tax=Sphingomonas kaistensis TaxID=298708 RepID=A0A7X5Y726_9SPHN|nr:hypothetical protein [Sphingomonas kaistensis]NJC05095.1 hypothetical protein [Sphingomonas kaistensis]